MRPPRPPTTRFKKIELIHSLTSYVLGGLGGHPLRPPNGNLQKGDRRWAGGVSASTAPEAGGREESPAEAKALLAATRVGGCVVDIPLVHSGHPESLPRPDMPP